MPARPSLTAPPSALFVDGVSVPDVRAIEGLDMAADIGITNVGPNVSPKKHVASVRWTPALITLGLGMGKQMGDWLHRSLTLPAATASGSVVIGDISHRAKSALAFTNALLTRLTVPALDASSRDSGALLVGFEAEQVEITAGDGADIRTKPPRAKWICSNFKVEIDGLPCARVTRVESFTWTREISASPGDSSRNPLRQPTNAAVPDLQLTISAADYPEWADAARSWFVDGKHLEADEKAGRIVLLSPDQRNELATISFANIGFRKFQTLQTTGTAVARFSVTLYTETMSFALK